MSVNFCFPLTNSRLCPEFNGMHCSCLYHIVIRYTLPYLQSSLLSRNLTLYNHFSLPIWTLSIFDIFGQTTLKPTSCLPACLPHPNSSSSSSLPQLIWDTCIFRFRLLSLHHSPSLTFDQCPKIFILPPKVTKISLNLPQNTSPHSTKIIYDGTKCTFYIILYSFWVGPFKLKTSIGMLVLHDDANHSPFRDTKTFDDFLQARTMDTSPSVINEFKVISFFLFYPYFR
jgi:hypothetical protein